MSINYFSSYMKTYRNEPRNRAMSWGTITGQGTKGEGYYNIEIWGVKYNNVPVLGAATTIKYFEGETVVLGYNNGRNFIIGGSSRKTKKTD